MKRVYLHSKTIRIWHWIQAIIVMILMITGAQLRVPDLTTAPLYRLAVLIHLYAGYAMAAGFLFWLVYSAVSGSLRRHYVLRLDDAGLMRKQVLYYLYGILRGRQNPFTPTPAAKFNPLQKIAYASVMFIFTPLIVITGVLYSDIFTFRELIGRTFGIRYLAALHVAVSYIFLCYLAVHIYLSTLGPSVFSHIKAMITGWEEEPEEEGPVNEA
jgi:thiosulfate reductase cytochrome b subunit